MRIKPPSWFGALRRIWSLVLSRVTPMELIKRAEQAFRPSPSSPKHPLRSKQKVGWAKLVPSPWQQLKVKSCFFTSIRNFKKEAKWGNRYCSLRACPSTPLFLYPRTVEAHCVTIEKFLLSNFLWSITPLFEHILLHMHYKMCSKSGVMDHCKFDS